MAPDSGLHLAFEPMPSLGSYDIYLLNCTAHAYACHCIFRTVEGLLFEFQDKLAAGASKAVGHLLVDQLNDRPEASLRCHRLSTEGLGQSVGRQRRIKPKLFFGSPPQLELLGRPAFLFRMIEAGSLGDAPGSAEDLSTYTRRHLRRKDPPKPDASPWLDLQRAANFPSAIDLHAEKAFPQWERMAPDEIFAAQLRLFDEYLADAIRFHMAKVTIIHGKGEGRLRDAIRRRLSDNDQVLKFNYTHDFGATEVYL